MNLPNLSEEKFLNIILYGSSLFSDSQNQSILNSTIKYITDSNCFLGLFFKVVGDIVSMYLWYMYALGIMLRHS